MTGQLHKDWAYRIMGSHTGHWGTIKNPLPNPGAVTSLLLELTYTPSKLDNFQFVSGIASDFSNLIGNNLGGMITIRKTGIFTK